MSFIGTPEVTALAARLIESLGAVVAASRIVRDSDLTADNRQVLLDALESQAAICIDIAHELSLAAKINEMRGHAYY